MLERKFHKGSFAAIALQAAPARFGASITPTPQGIAHEQQPARAPGHCARAAVDPFFRAAKTEQHAEQPSAASRRDWPQAALRDLQLGAWVTVVGRREGEAPMIVVSEDRLKHTHTHTHTMRLMHARHAGSVLTALCCPYMLRPGSDGAVVSAARTARDGPVAEIAKAPPGAHARWNL